MLFPGERLLIESLVSSQNKLETQYAMKLEAALNDVGDLKQQLELKAQENKTTVAVVESLRGTNAELEVHVASSLS